MLSFPPLHSISRTSSAGSNFSGNVSDHEDTNPTLSTVTLPPLIKEGIAAQSPVSVNIVQAVEDEKVEGPARSTYTQDESLAVYVARAHFLAYGNEPRVSVNARSRPTTANALCVYGEAKMLEEDKKSELNYKKRDEHELQWLSRPSTAPSSMRISGLSALPKARFSNEKIGGQKKSQRRKSSNFNS